MQEKGWIRKLFRQRFIVAVALILQVVILIYTITSRSQTSQLFGMLMEIVSFVVSLYVAFQPGKTVYKVSWIILILAFPLFGGMLYLLLYLQTMNERRYAAKLPHLDCAELARLPGDAKAAFGDAAPQHVHQVQYLQEHAGYPVYTDTQTHYMSPGEAALPVILEELEKAERYIFLEFFIVQEGIMWNSILEVLKRKVKEGVKVRMIYDDIGCFLLLPKNYPKALREYGIECVAFNPFRPLLTVTQNNRDHRKIIVIDGKTAFTGGINLADEYINAIEKYGYWKDACVRLQGKAAWCFTVMFLDMWRLCSGKGEDIRAFYPSDFTGAAPDGFVQPYGDTPVDTEFVGEHVYLQMIHSAREYLYINTPYLVIDETMMTALSMAAKSGVDVRIVTPHHWDKKFVHMTTRSYYGELLDTGVKIYEYTPGFMHAKVMISDDSTAVIGTVNLDYRSLYLHYECGVWLYGSRAVLEAKQDFLKTLEDCTQIKAVDGPTKLFTKIKLVVLRLLAPLM